jgi:hypothetical protein
MSAKAGGKEQQRSEGQWRMLLQRFAASGSSVEAFCRSEAISPASFYRWRARLASHAKRGVVLREYNAPVFVNAGTLSMKPAPSARLELKLDLGEGWVLQLVRG